MMNVLVNGEQRTLSLVDANGTEWVNDFIGNAGGFEEIVPDGEGNFTATEEAFEWWSEVVETQQALSNRIAELSERFGSEVVEKALQGTDASDVPDEQANQNAALDELEEARAGK